MIKKFIIAILFTLVLSGGAYAIFADPLEKCMNRVIKGTYDNDEFFAAKAANACNRANNVTEKCMDRVIKGTYDNDEFFALKAAEVCLGN